MATVRDGTLSLIEGYRLEKQIESRSYGETYQAHQDQSDALCRVRILKADADATKVFLSDTKIVTTFFHPNVTGIYDAGVLDSGEVFVVAEEVDGRTVREVLDEVGTPELPTSIEIVRQVAEALHALHQSGLRHGAVRPESIVLTKNAGHGLRAMLRDLDLGGVVQSSIISNKFTIESALDSLRYFAPEQFAPGKIDARTDVYSLGVVFYELLCGSPPFDASTATGLIHMHKNQSPPELKISDYNLRMLVTHALTESLQKQARLRQSSANALARQLRHIEQLATHISTPPPAGVVPATRARSRSVPSPAATVVGSAQEIKEPVMLRGNGAVPIVPSKADAVQPEIPKIAESKVEIPTAVKPEIPKVVEPKAEIPTAVEVPVAPLMKTADAPVIQAAKIDEQPVVLAGAEKDPPEVQIIESVPEVQAPRRSRLKSLKKKLHAMSSMVETVRQQFQTSSVQSISPQETVEMPTEGSEAATLALEPVKLKKVEWVQPDDDIPTPAELQKVLDQDGAENIPETTKPVVVPPKVKTEPATVIATLVLPEPLPKIAPKPVVPKRIALVPDVPVAEPVAAKAEKTKPDAPVITPEKTTTPRPVPVSPKPVTPAPVIRVPVVAAMNADVQKKPRSIEPNRTPAPRGIEPKPSKKPSEFAITHGLPPGARPVYPVVIQPDPDEITLVRARPRNRIRVDINKSAPKARERVPVSQVAFSPTILGKRPEEFKAKVEQPESIFAAVVPDSSRAIPYRAIAIGIGCVGLLSVALFASDSVSNFVQSMIPGDSVTAKATVTKEQAPAPSAAPGLTPPSGTAAGVRFTPAPVTKEKVPVPKTETTSAKATTAAKSPAERSSKTTTPTVARETKPRPEPVRTKQPAKPRASVADKSTTGTRPRIVRDSRQE